MHRRALAAICLAAPLALIARDAAADALASGVRLSWVRGEGADACPDVAAIERDVVRYLGRDVFSGAEAQSIEATVAREGLAWRARIYVRDAAGRLLDSREFTNDARDCEPIRSAAVLTIVLAIDPEALSHPPPSPAPSPPPPPAPPARAPVRAPTAQQPRLASSRRSPRDGEASASLRLVANVGLLPAVAPGVALATDAPLAGLFRWTSGVAFFPEVPTANGDLGLGLTAFWLAPCVAPLRHSRLLLEACVGPSLGVVHSVVYHPEPATPGDRFWSEVSASLRVAVRVVGPLVLEAGVEAGVPVTRYRFLLEGSTDPLFQQPWVTASGHVGVGAYFW